jgi:hypothetical protein
MKATQIEKETTVKSAISMYSKDYQEKFINAAITYSKIWHKMPYTKDEILRRSISTYNNMFSFHLLTK